MKKIVYFFMLFSFYLNSQTQIGNSGFEDWENMGQTNEEPTNWNSFKTASGAWNSFGSQQVKRSSEKRPGTTGNYSAQIWTKNVTLAVANGNLTLGRINMGSTTPTSTENYNYSLTSDEQFSEALTQTPDSIAFWVKFSPINNTHEARISSAIHDNIDFKDPNDLGGPSKVAEAIYNFPTTNGQWVRKSYPFTKTSNTNAKFIIVTFTSNKTPGVGTDNGTESTRDNLWIDDIELIYPSTSNINELKTSPFFVQVQENELSINFTQNGENNISICNSLGKIVYEEKVLNSSIKINLDSGYYFIKVKNNNSSFISKAFIY